MSQKDAILTHLTYGNSLTPVEALELFGTFRLSERIREIERLGAHIERKWARTYNGARVRSYRIAK